MKSKLLYFLPIIIAFASGCSSNKIQPTPTAPEGNFTGRFTLLHKHVATGKIDTLTANIQLAMNLTTGYKVTGDTSTIHAGSYGTYSVNASGTGIQFIDQTFPATGTPAKIHLSGIYGYAYDGTILQMAGRGALDTLAFVYDLTKK